MIKTIVGGINQYDILKQDNIDRLKTITKLQEYLNKENILSALNLKPGQNSIELYNLKSIIQIFNCCYGFEDLSILQNIL